MPPFSTALELDPDLLESLTVSEHLHPVFQPLVNRKLEIVTHEALMRVFDPSGFPRNLKDYISQLEKYGLISLADIRMANLVGSELSKGILRSVAINVSLQTLHHRLQSYIKSLSTAKDSEAEVIIEITETSPVVDVGKLKECTDVLKMEGFLVAFDDANPDNAYGNPHFIRRCKPDILKIDGLYFHQAIFYKEKIFELQDIVNTAHECGAKVVFEWIDTEDRMNAALKLGADFMQGFMLGMPADHHAKEIARHQIRKEKQFA